jgi:hypothetical protein
MAAARPRLVDCFNIASKRRTSRHFSSTISRNSGTTIPSSIAHLLDHGVSQPSNVAVNGFVRSVRNQKRRSFVAIGDGSTLEPLQALLTPKQALKYGNRSSPERQLLTEPIQVFLPELLFGLPDNGKNHQTRRHKATSFMYRKSISWAYPMQLYV